MSIQTITKNDYLELIGIWESSVRTTHDFLTEEEILELKPLILEHYFDSVDLRCLKTTNNNISGFIGVAESNIEMLFVAPEYFRRGVGKQLTMYAINRQDATKVDVNEQNPSAIEFYKSLGFVEVSRSPLDGQGKPFPLIHMVLDEI
jgi:putative acetyltransferase